MTKGKLASARSALEAEMAMHLRTTGHHWDAEYRWHPTRKWRADFAIPALRLMLEVEGGVWVAGRHNRGQGFIDDCEKYSEAALHGWLVLRVTGEHIKSGQALLWAERALALRRSEMAYTAPM